MKNRILSLIAAAAVVMPAMTSAKAAVVVPPPKPVPTCFGSGCSGSTPVAPFIIMGCAAGVVVAALIKNWANHRELTPLEAATCGLGAAFTNQ